MTDQDTPPRPRPPRHHLAEVGRTRSRVRDRNSRRILAAVGEHLGSGRVERPSMRQLADVADVSVRTLYNLFDDRNGLLRALVLDSIAQVDLAVDALRAVDPVERAWETVEVAMTTVTTSLPRAVLAEVLDDPRLLVQLSEHWNVRDLLIDAVHDAQAAGDLHDDIDATLLVDQVGMTVINLLRGWATDLIGDDALVAGTLHALDLCLLAIARPTTRDVVRDHALELAPRLARPVRA